jgi:lauroyl/myristoyl acyltransferase
MLDLLGKGEVIAIASDVPGQGRMRFLGRNVAGASGVSRLAVESRAPVVPVTVRPEGVGQRAVVGEPIDSRAFTDPSRLLQEIMRQHEPSVLAWPEALLWPLERWRVSPEDVDELGLNDPRMTRPLLI